MIDHDYDDSIRRFCVDCGLDCCAPTGREYYYVKAGVWNKSGLRANGGFLCVGCLEARIGRELRRTDFVGNARQSPENSARLNDRLGRA